MGGQEPPLTLLHGVDEAIALLPTGVHITLLISQDFVLSFQEKLGKNSRFSLVSFPSHTLSNGVQLLRKKEIDALVTAGETRELITSASLTLENLPHIKRAALLVNFPTESGNITLLDVGANVACRGLHLEQFAKLGVAYYRALFPGRSPRVGLLNIGQESFKGRPEQKEAYEALLRGPYEFVGNIEGDRAFSGVADILVTDGYSGNIFLKSVEGICSYLWRSFEAKGADVSIFQNLKTFTEPNAYPGALLCGSESLILKCHGSVSPRGLGLAILGAYQYHSLGLISKMRFLLDS